MDLDGGCEIGRARFVEPVVVGEPRVGLGDRDEIARAWMIEPGRALDNYRAYAKLHTALFPYLYTYAKQASVDGTPLIRPLPLVDPNDTTADEYWLGGELLVAPVLEKSSLSRTVTLPAGTWFDYWTNKKVEGTITWSGPQTQIPLFVRAGAIVPRISQDIQTLTDAAYVDNPTIRTADDALDFLIYPSGSSHLVVYDDTEVSVDVIETTKITVKSVARPLQLDVYAVAHPTSVRIDGTERAEGDGWQFDGTFVTLTLAHAGGTTTIEFGGISPDETSPGGCGCHASGDGSGLIVVLVLAWSVRRRRCRN